VVREHIAWEYGRCTFAGNGETEIVDAALIWTSQGGNLDGLTTHGDGAAMRIARDKPCMERNISV